MAMDDGSLAIGDATLDYDDDADAEGLEGLSEAQDRLDAENAQHMAGIAKEEPRPTTAAKPAASAQGGQSAPTATDASPEAQAAPGASPAPQELDLMVEVEEEVDPVVTFINSVGKCGSWIEGVSSLGQLMRLRALEAHELRGARVALWNAPCRVKDKVDPAAHPTNFVVWLEVAPEEDQVDGTLMTLENSAEWARLTPAQHDKVRVQAAQAKIRIRNHGAEMS